MFWKKKPKDGYLVPHRNECNKMASALLDASGVDFDSASDLDQALLGTFLFGMIFTHGKFGGLSPPDVHAIALCVFKDTLHYTDQAAAQGVQECINATKPNYHPTMNAILHRGIEGHRQYIEKDIESLSANVRFVLEKFNSKG
jgi:hypothetical protein